MFGHPPKDRWIGDHQRDFRFPNWKPASYEMNPGDKRAWTAESRISIAFHVVK
jgi:hypothetical protein